MNSETAIQSPVRDSRIDLLKAFAVVLVVLYHCGLLTRGYLGVDSFFVIGGFFMMRGFLREKAAGKNYFSETVRKILRFWPLVLVTIAVTLIAGFFTMLPDDFENLGESAVASGIFAENVLSAVTTKNYWNTANDYKPLMHLWYIGVLVQAYILLPLLFRLLYLKKSKKCLKIGVAAAAAVSFAAYLLPGISAADKFYYLPFRAFEMLAGSLVFLLKKRTFGRRVHAVGIAAAGMALAFFGTVNTALDDRIYLIGTVAATAVLLYFWHNSVPTVPRWLKGVAGIGTASYSIYVVHQPIIAFTRYWFTTRISGVTFVLVAGVIAGASAGAYFLTERKAVAIAKRQKIRLPAVACVLAAGILCAAGGVVYLRAGVVRDVPELEITVQTAQRGMHAQYVDIPYQWNRDFTDANARHLLVVGDSMARDWCNILNESELRENFEISYIYLADVTEKYRHRFQAADYIFYATIGDAIQIENALVREYAAQQNFYVVGIKNFGTCNGQIYQRRHRSDYFLSAVTPGRTNHAAYKTFSEQNAAQKEFYADRYIDLIAAVQNSDGTVPVFTDTCKFISADTEHLTRAGAVYYAKILDLSRFL